jgi:hypothetical protein
MLVNASNKASYKVQYS